MVVTEYYKTREDGVRLVRTYSNAGMMIERDGVVYDEAIDPEELGRDYIETDEPCEGATEADYLAVLAELGVAFDE